MRHRHLAALPAEARHGGGVAARAGCPGGGVQRRACVCLVGGLADGREASSVYPEQPAASLPLLIVVGGCPSARVASRGRARPDPNPALLR